jgi:hypothetical protein
MISPQSQPITTALGLTFAITLLARADELDDRPSTGRGSDDRLRLPRAGRSFVPGFSCQRSTVSAQLLLNPIAGSEATFRSTWLQTYDSAAQGKSELLQAQLLIKHVRPRRSGATHAPHSLAGDC